MALFLREKSMDFQELILNWNRTAMENLRQGNVSASFQLLNKAQDFLDQPHDREIKMKLKAITFNNLGCFYKKTGKVSLALKFLQKALDLDVTSPSEKTNLAGTHLNMCAIQSGMGNHELAIKHALKAIEFLKDVEEVEFAPSIGATTAIAYHNAGVEYEYLKNYEKAEECYKIGYGKAEENIGTGHNITEALLSCYNNVKSIRELQRTKEVKYYFEKSRAKSMRSVSERDTYRPNNSGPRKKEKPLLPIIKNVGKPKQKGKSKSFDYSYSPDIKLYGITGRNSSIEKPINLQRKIKSTNKMEMFIPTDLFNLKKEKPSYSLRNIASNNENDLPLKEVLEKLKTIENQSSDLHGKRKVHTKEIKNTEKERNFRPSSSFNDEIDKSPIPVKAVLKFPAIKLDLVDYAIKIQKIWKGYIARKKYKRLRLEAAHVKAKNAIETLEELKKQLKEEEKTIETKPISPLPLIPPSFPYKKPEKTFRKIQLAPIPEKKLENKIDKLIKIQAIIKGFIEKRKFLKKKQAAIMIQSYMKMIQAKRLYNYIRNAVIYIQYCWQEYSLRKLKRNSN
ncbi:unnamed protein product [Blepharisma stoltei]|uniref:Uncharacterized protein n=1 Tax=Blepharisma stoltei TaxID=1481888 RepID=A0AAU9JFS9_9CILI|nr:unnamed protein product [Blepharisma stoltei]